MGSTVGQRTRAYFGLAPDNGEQPPADRTLRTRQVVVGAVLLSASVLIWIFWSARFGSWMFYFTLIFAVILPVHGYYQRRDDHRDGG
jgi:hypothetical protein